MEEKKKDASKDVIEIPVGKYFGKFRDNPWIISTIILGIVLIGIIIFANGKISGSAVSGDVATNNLISFIKSQNKGDIKDITVVSTEKEGSLYKVTINYQGQDVPVYVSLDGKYLIGNVVPLDPSLYSALDSGNANAVEVDAGDSPMIGDKNADITIVEFSDFECPYCGRFYSETLSSIEKNYIDAGKVRLYYMDFPLTEIHPNAQKAAEAARCVREQKGDDGFWKMHNKLFENQQDLSIDNFKKWARELGVSGSKFDECLDKGKYSSAVQDDSAYGQSLGVQGTPAFFINGKLLSGAQPYSAFEQAIDEALSGNTGTAKSL